MQRRHLHAAPLQKRTRHCSTIFSPPMCADPSFSCRAWCNTCWSARRRARSSTCFRSTSIAVSPFLAAYSASKGALATLTRNTANAYRGNRIRCNAVLLGWMDTEGEDMVQRKWHGAGDDWLQKAEAAQPMGQLVKPGQLARLITYMLSPDSGVMTGALVDYDQNVLGVFGG